MGAARSGDAFGQPCREQSGGTAHFSCPNSAATVPSPPLHLKSFTPRKSQHLVQDSIPERRKFHPTSSQELCAAADLGFCKPQVSPAWRARFQAPHTSAVTFLTNFGTKSCSADLTYFSKTFWDGNRRDLYGHLLSGHSLVLFWDQGIPSD